jgi:hypothetical protein
LGQAGVLADLRPPARTFVIIGNRGAPNHA